MGVFLKRLVRTECDELFSVGKKAFGIYVSARFSTQKADVITEDETPTLSYSVIISKKVAKKAHDRNLCKRRVRAAVREVARNLNKEKKLSASSKVLFTIGKDCRDVPFQELKGDIEKILSHVSETSV